MNFIEYCISQGYKAYRKMYNSSSKRWEYVEEEDTTYFSSSAPGYIDIRLLKDGYKEIVYGLPCVSHPPALIFPDPFGDIYEIDRAFEDLSYEEILNAIEKLSKK